MNLINNYSKKRLFLWIIFEKSWNTYQKRKAPFKDGTLKGAYSWKYIINIAKKN